MKFQILNILIYGTNGQTRSIELKPDAVNIITGRSGTGKSALIHIVDYCLGRDECYVYLGVIRKHVEWYAIKLQTSSGEIFIARRNPEPGKKSSEDIYIERGTSLGFPEARNLIKNSNLDTLTSILNQVLGIDEYTHEPKAGQTRKTGTADIRKALFYCFQGQSEIDNQDFLFHRQGESTFLARSIQDYLPYFLGAITDEFVQNKEELRKLNRKLKQIELKIAEHNRLKGQNFERAFALLNEAKSVDLIAADEPLQASWDNVQQLIEAALARNIDNNPAEPNVDVLNDLLDHQQQIREAYRIAATKLKSLKDLKRSSNGFGSEMEEQKSRLESINIFDHTGSPNICPLCSSTLPSAVPSVEAIRASLTDINFQLEAVTNDTPYLDAMITRAGDQLAMVKRKLDEVKTSIISLQTTNQRISELRDFNSRQAMIKGRLSLYLENMPTKDLDDSDNIKAEKLAEQISVLEAILDDEAPAERLESILSLVSLQITLLARKLKIEHSDSPMRLDLKKLTIVADNADDGAIPMSKMGSGETWVGLHLVTHLALHNWFFKKQRPVPQFLFLDQPSQAYFPPDTPAETVREQTETMNPDRQSVIRMFKLIVEEAKNFQVIVTEHANIREEWYQALVRENWWDGKRKLVPVEWTEVE